MKLSLIYAQYAQRFIEISSAILIKVNQTYPDIATYKHIPNGFKTLLLTNKVQLVSETKV